MRTPLARAARAEHGSPPGIVPSGSDTWVPIGSLNKHSKSKSSELLTISVGIYSAIPTTEDAAEDFYSKADIALYEAKSKRNAIVVYL